MTTKPTETQPFFTHWEYEKAQDVVAGLYRKAGAVGLSENELLELDEYISRSAITHDYFSKRKQTATC